MSHLLLQCAFSMKVWFRILRVGGFQYLAPMPDEQWPDYWWLRRRKQVQKDQRKGFDAMVVLVTWRLWKERNQRVFDHVSVQAPQLAVAVLEGRAWLQAGFQALVEWLDA
jgi:predicted SAM-dependent methyltransferase